MQMNHILSKLQTVRVYGSANSSSGTDGGGGGGAGGLIYRPGFPVTPGAQIPGSVGAGNPSQGTFAQDGPNKVNGADSVFGTLTAKGGRFIS
jgi:hypothetical protein